ncbi:hypothetical protein BAUCODRAFT_397192 [Baudoinia panamericana UAMH 10762]|uniref:Zn(2)-C6 fungal-type domain-containing protein n=1 Tax=Baudoinia panamericana (strain UAMH 10762) TaxID=717646 RepID=M2N5H2_BAUPA|nr:uncharacterized protein BAUCODRAFT_397192 [Baudoinia panamericana UAMH 10762]EMC99283.1 hypothetical protein BAUCODRAFT_397192 [Baudoinia panamericana UAMH 10762]
MPRTGHKKVKTGCLRCKERKVKCSESRPKCTACERQAVECVYKTPVPRRTATEDDPGVQRTSEPVHRSAESTPVIPSVDPLEHANELRLMHEWTAYTSRAFSPSWEYWSHQVPILAVEHRSLLDALFAFAAMGKYRRINAGTASGCEPSVSEPDLLVQARAYFNRSLERFRPPTGDDTVPADTAEALYATSILLSLLTLSEMKRYSEDSEENSPSKRFEMWLKFSTVTRESYNKCQSALSPDRLNILDSFCGARCTTEEDELFRIEQGTPFSHLLTFASEYENITAEDQAAYEKLLGCVVFLFKAASSGEYTCLQLCQRLIALPSRLPQRAVDLISRKTPRALVMLAHAFAVMRLIENEILWLKGVSDAQLDLIDANVPRGWKERMGWPMLVKEGRCQTLPPANHFGVPLSFAVALPKFNTDTCVAARSL